MAHKSGPNQQLFSQVDALMETIKSNVISTIAHTFCRELDAQTNQLVTLMEAEITRRVEERLAAAGQLKTATTTATVTTQTSTPILAHLIGTPPAIVPPGASPLLQRPSQTVVNGQQQQQQIISSIPLQSWSNMNPESQTMPGPSSSSGITTPELNALLQSPPTSAPIIITQYSASSSQIHPPTNGQMAVANHSAGEPSLRNSSRSSFDVPIIDLSSDEDDDPNTECGCTQCRPSDQQPGRASKRPRIGEVGPSGVQPHRPPRRPNTRNNHFPYNIIYLNCTQANCRAILSTEEQLVEHLQAFHQIGPHPCLIVSCERSFETSDALKTHINTDHRPTETATWNCPHCTDGQSQGLTKRTHVKNHLKFAHQRGRFACSYGCSDIPGTSKTCDFIGATRQAVFMHAAQTHGYQCQGCGRRFQSQSQLLEHQTTSPSCCRRPI